MVQSSLVPSKDGLNAERSTSQFDGLIADPGDVPHDVSGSQTANSPTTSQGLTRATTTNSQSTRACVDTPSTVFLGESSSLNWAKDSVHRSEADGGPNQSKVRLCFSLPPAQGGEVSTLSLARSGRSAKRVEYLEKIGAFTFPSDAQCQNVLLAYFKWFHPCFPIIDRPLFASAFASRTVSPLLLQAMLFVGATYCNDDLLRSMGFADRLDARTSFYSRAKDIYDTDHEQEKLTIVQALFLMSYWRAGPQIEKNTRHWLAAATNLAQTQGVHRTSVTFCSQGL